MQEKLNINENENIDMDINISKNNQKNLKKNKNKSKFSLLLIISFLILILLIFLYNYYFSKNNLYNILVGDIGGTNIRLQLLKMSSNINIEPIKIKSEYKSTFLFSSLENLLKDFISHLDEKNKPQFAVLGIPGPVEDNKIITLPNIPHWRLENGDALGKKLGIKKFIFFL